jgi:hypothetical protein
LAFEDKKMKKIEGGLGIGLAAEGIRFIAFRPL